MIGFINFETLNRWLEISRERYPRNDKSLLWLCFEFRASTFVPRLPRSKDEKTKMEGTSILVSLPPLVSLPSHCTIPCLPPVVVDARVCRSQNLGRAQCSSFMRGILARGGRFTTRRGPILYTDGKVEEKFPRSIHFLSLKTDIFFFQKSCELIAIFQRPDPPFVVYPFPFPPPLPPPRLPFSFRESFLGVVNWSAVNRKDFISLGNNNNNDVSIDR